MNRAGRAQLCRGRMGRSPPWTATSGQVLAGCRDMQRARTRRRLPDRCCRCGGFGAQTSAFGPTRTPSGRCPAWRANASRREGIGALPHRATMFLRGRPAQTVIARRMIFRGRGRGQARANARPAAAHAAGRFPRASFETMQGQAGVHAAYSDDAPLHEFMPSSRSVLREGWRNASNLPLADVTSKRVGSAGRIQPKCCGLRGVGGWGICTVPGDLARCRRGRSCEVTAGGLGERLSAVVAGDQMITRSSRRAGRSKLVKSGSNGVACGPCDETRPRISPIASG